LIEGFKDILDHCLGTKKAEQTQEQRELDQRLQQLGAERNQDRGFFKWLFGSSQQSYDDANALLKDAVAEKAQAILTACLSCWNDVDVFRAREYFFTTLGMFAYNDEDRSTVKKRLETAEAFVAGGGENSKAQLKKTRAESGE